MIRRILLAAALVLGVTSPSLAASDPLVRELQQRYNDMQGFTATFTQSLTHQESGAVEDRKGSLAFQKPLRLRWETAKPHPELLVINDQEVWDYLPDEALAYRYAPEVAQDSRSIIQVITGQSRLDKDFVVERQPDDSGLAVLRLYPKDPTPQLVEATLWVNPATKLIKKASLLDFYGNGNTIVFVTLTPDASSPANTFAFTPPKDVEVEDLQKQAAPERGLLQ